jgi:hypothetical protein
MKNVLSILFMFLFLVGCSANAAPKNVGTNANAKNTFNESSTPAKQMIQGQNQLTIDQYQPNPQVTDDRSLQQIDQTYADDKGEATLKAIKNVNQTYQIGPIELTVKEMKWIPLRPDYSMIDFFHVLTHDEEFDFVKVFVEVKNTSAEKVHFAPIALLKTSTGETFDWEKDIYLEELNGEYDGNSAKFGNLCFIVNASDSAKHENEHRDEEGGVENNHSNEVQDIEWIETTTSDVFNKKQKKISESQKIKIKF